MPSVTAPITPLQPVKKIHIQPNDKPVKAPMSSGWVTAVTAALEEPKDKAEDHSGDRQRLWRSSINGVEGRSMIRSS